ncbi:hypothetical protein [Paenibacillus xylanexedens]|uniref:hypothetical protein n=1 Tax=Paenibacillus xylanexedens TaxID=528191 RepID=UPI000F52CA1E|nr:hypothetical protein [Paenibacillus xylanexedens]RPK29389.1 hypothetical protein EDO6_00012 [Paenibacillus xylanexedens]
MNKQTTTYEAFEGLQKVWNGIENEQFQELLESNEKLIINIIQAAKKFNVINEVHDYLVDQVDKPIEKGGISRDTFQYFVDLMIESE